MELAEGCFAVIYESHFVGQRSLTRVSQKTILLWDNAVILGAGNAGSRVRNPPANMPVLTAQEAC